MHFQSYKNAPFAEYDQRKKSPMAWTEMGGFIQAKDIVCLLLNPISIRLLKKNKAWNFASSL